ncbi:MAG: 16S rRNA (uracil(1498)-N(3))-methyltransferase [Desulfobacterales bacterium]|nr:16S rRNA (uracil(1498)-N(3))-methyltransferase [Desulfobacterales bacterium]
MKRFFVDEIRVVDGVCSIRGPEARHISKVLRMGPGTRFILNDGKGSCYQVLIESANSQEIRVVLEKSLPAPTEPPVTIILCQAVLKQRPMDYIIQKTSELGVGSILPFSSERTVVRVEKNRLTNKMGHWNAVAQSSAKQCGRGVPAKIEFICSFEELVAKLKGYDARKVILWEDEKSQDLKSILKASASTKDFIGIVGPEGGFSKQEVAAAGDADFVSVSMGSRILRADTAAITMVALVQYELGDLGLGNI